MYAIDNFKSEKGMIKKFNITLTNNQTEIGGYNVITGYCVCDERY